MSNTTQLLLIGILFVIIGLGTLLIKKKKKLVGLVPLTIGTVAILFVTVGPLSNSPVEINKVLHLNKDQITNIIIKPTEYRGYEEISLTKTVIEITDKSTLDNLCSALTKARVTNSIIKNPKWVCLVRLNRKDKSFIELEVKNAGKDSFVEIKSNGDYGWNYGTLDASYFGQMLISLTK